MASRRRKLLRWAGLGIIGVSCVALASCVRVSDGTWYVREAALPEGWPSLTPVGKVEIKDYPLYRAAVVRDADLDGDGMDPMFSTLFGHIKERKIAMTAPVEMGYESESATDSSTVSTMAFLYRTPTQGKLENDGRVAVRDLPARRYASVGVRGDYRDDRFAENLAVVDAWLAEHADDWLLDGSPRYLGYNSPFILPFMRYGEVQVPVRAVGE